MILIRKGTFETNSSSTHSLTMCTKEEYDKWIMGELFYFLGHQTFVDEKGKEEIIRENILDKKIKIDWNKKTIAFKGETISYDTYEDRKEKIQKFFTTENLEEITQEEIEKYLEMEEDYYVVPMTYSQYCDYIQEYEAFSQTYKTPKGEEVVSFGYFGYDG